MAGRRVRRGQAPAGLNAAHRDFFSSVSGRRKGPKLAPPRLRPRKDRRQAIRFTAGARFESVPGGGPRPPKLGDVPVRWSRPLPAGPSGVAVIRDSAGRCFASFAVEVSPRPLPETGAERGIDPGLGRFAVPGDGTKIAAPKFLRRAEKKLKRAQRDPSRKQEGSRSKERARASRAGTRESRMHGAASTASSPRRSSAETRR